MKPIPRVPAALCGLYVGVRITSDAYGRRVVGRVTEFCPDDADFVAVDYEPKGFGTLLIAETSLLLDSPLAMCHAARWLATRLGMDTGSTAPLWAAGRTGGGIRYWQLKSHETTGLHNVGFRCFIGDPTNPVMQYVPGISDLTDPAAALAAACVAVGAAPA